MKKAIFLALIAMSFLQVPANAMALPTIPEEVQQVIPQESASFLDSLWQIIKSAFLQAQPQVASSSKLCISLFAVAVVLSVLNAFDGASKSMVELAGVVTVASLLLSKTNSMISLGTQTVEQIVSFGKLMLPVMAAALAGQGGITSSAALFAVTAMFDTILSSVISAVLIPAVYIYLVLCTVNCATGDSVLKKLQDFVKWSLTWLLKMVLYVFTGYISLTGVITGSADQLAVKATKLTISGMLPVVGGILSDASETVLISAATVKNGAGVAGLCAILAVTITPIFIIGLHYLLLKATAALVAIFAPKSVSNLVDDFSGAMGMILGMTGAVSLIQMISLVCFMKGMG